MARKNCYNGKEKKRRPDFPRENAGWVRQCRRLAENEAYGMKILVTGFDPFGGEAVNPAQQAVERMRAPQGAALCRLIVPTVFGKSVEAVRQKMREERPDAVVCVGQAGGRCGITLERVAVNLEDASIPDNEGNRPVDVPVCAGGPAAYFSTLPVRAIVAALRAAGLPAALSLTAGTFVCNHLMYGMLDAIAHEFPGTRGGFLHVPFVPAQAAERPGMPSMALPDIVRALEIAAETVAGELSAPAPGGAGL